MKVFVYAFHKTASMFLYRYFKELAVLSGAAYFSVNNTPPDQQGWEGYAGNYIVCPVRFQDHVFMDMESTIKNVIHLRDPIDVLISQYFSFGWTHTPRNNGLFQKKREAIQQKSIDQYCLEECSIVAAKYRTLMAQYHSIPNKILSDYSAMRDDFKQWNTYICRSVLGRSDEKIEKTLLKKFRREFGYSHRILHWYITPKEIIFGKKTPHRRDGGDNQKDRYLQPETVKQLEHEMNDVLAFFAAFQSAYEQQA